MWSCSAQVYPNWAESTKLFQWSTADARELFIGCYDLLGPLAALRVRQIITRYSPELADRAAYHSSELKLSAAPDTLAAGG